MSNLDTEIIRLEIAELPEDEYQEVAGAPTIDNEPPPD